MDIKTTEDAYRAYDESLDEGIGDIEIGTFTYPASQVLLAVDPIAYRCDFNDWCDAMGIDTSQLVGDFYRH